MNRLAENEKNKHMALECNIERDIKRHTNNSEVRTQTAGSRHRDPHFGIRTSGLRDSDIGARTSDIGARTAGFGPRDSDLGTRTSGLGPRDSVVGTRTSGLGRRDLGALDLGAMDLGPWTF